jgi:phospholipid/cholesterol/gamma-HCH transport system substrate-binding protein
MSQISAAQRARLGVFLLVAAALVLGSLVALVGKALLEKRDTYFVYFEGSVSGLEPGSAVKYNGIQVGRVEKVEIDKANVARVQVEVSLKEGTPVKADTMAALNLQGITGQMFVELAGGTNEAETIAPGSEIASQPSQLGALLERASSIATKLDGLVENLVDLTSEKNSAKITATLTEVEGIARNVGGLLNSARPRIESILANTDAATATTAELLVEGKALVSDARMFVSVASQGVERASQWVDPSSVEKVLKSVDSAVRTAERRMSREELGQALAEYTELAKSSRGLVEVANLTLIRARDDLLRALDELVTGAESFAEFAAILRDDPSAILRGRSEEERDLP